ncbi:MAG: hypothetical protein JKY98_01890 [Gammaproteobacteria bacterium]|nr:hypothetical protein [Gammaproteobacteria bacterium]
MDNLEIPATLGEAIATEPMWLQAWVMVLVIAQLGAVLFIVGRDNGNWIIRKECLAIIPGFFVAAMILNLLYAQFGYVRLLGLAHVIGWSGPFIWVLMRRKIIGFASVYGKYIHFYLLISGLSLIIDSLDVVRYIVGDGDLFMRWGLL